jgi:hypothetical protein
MIAMPDNIGMEEIVKNLDMTNPKIIVLVIHIGMENDVSDIKTQVKIQNAKMVIIGSTLEKHVLFNNQLIFVEAAKDENEFIWN